MKAPTLEELAQLPKVVQDLQDEVRRLSIELESLKATSPTGLISLKEAARRLGVSYRTAKRRVADGDWDHVVTRVGSRVQIDLARLIEGADPDQIWLAVKHARC